MSQDDLSRECDNLLELESFTEGLVLHHIKERFARGTIYTSVGAILVAVNPYRALDIYDEGMMLRIWEQHLADTKGVYRVCANRGIPGNLLQSGRQQGHPVP